MKSTIHTFRNKKPVFVQADKFYVIKSKKSYDNLINKLLDIDAVFTPDIPEKELKYPLYLELVDNINCPTLIRVEKEVIVQAIEKQERLLKNLKESL